MAIVPVLKITIYGITNQKADVLDGLQDLGCLHLVNLTPGTGETAPVPGISVEAHEALQYLRSCPVERRQVRDRRQFDLAAVDREALEVRDCERRLRDDRDYLVKAIEALRPWGDFRLPAPEEHPGLRFWFYIVPHYRMAEVRALDAVWQSVDRDQRFEYVAVVGQTPPDGMPVAPEKLDPRPLSELVRRLEEVELELEELHWRRVQLTRWVHLLTQTLTEADDLAIREHAELLTLDDSRVFAVQGWVPQRELKTIGEFVREQGLAMTVSEPTEEDRPPTVLANPELLGGGQTVVTFYTTPGYHAWDPSAAVFFSFALFFGMIFSDAGYALLLAMALALSWRRLGSWHSGGRLRNLFLAMVLASLVYGVMVGSYFGLSPPGHSLLAAMAVLDSRDQSSMMRLSIFVGAAHLGLAHLVSAWRYRSGLRCLSPVGWIAMIAGGLLLGMKNFGVETPMGGEGPLDAWLLGGGAAAVLLFSSRRPLLGGLRNQAFRLLDGLKALAGVSQAFGDVLSYLRLFALGLATAQLAATFNDLAASMASRMRGLGILAAVLIVVLGHGLNLALAVMSGVVHGLRLNFIEFFNWSLPEEGYPYRPLRKKAGA